MAGDWIKMRHALTYDPAVVEIARVCKLDEFGVVGRLHAVWSWLDQHSENGTDVRISSAFLDRLTACPGFAEAMRTVSWISGRDGALTFPDYTTHNGETAKHRASEAKRKAEQREQAGHRDKCPGNTGTNVPHHAGPEKRREDTTPHSPPAEQGGAGCLNGPEPPKRRPPRTPRTVAGVQRAMAELRTEIDEVLRPGGCAMPQEPPPESGDAQRLAVLRARLADHERLLATVSDGGS